MRRFHRFGKEVTRQTGIALLNYLLAPRQRFPDGKWATVGELAECLQAQHRGVVALISRGEKPGWMMRKNSAEDGRQMEVHLLSKVERCRERLARLQRAELLSLQGAFAPP